MSNQARTDQAPLPVKRSDAKCLSSLPHHRSTILCNAGVALHVRGEDELAMKYYQDALRELVASHGNDVGKNTPPCYSGMTSPSLTDLEMDASDAVVDGWNYESTEDLYKLKAIEDPLTIHLVTDWNHLEKNISAVTLYNMGLIFLKENSYEVSARIFEMAINVAQGDVNDLLGTAALAMSAALNNLGQANYHLGQPKKAERFISSALDLVQKVLNGATSRLATAKRFSTIIFTNLAVVTATIGDQLLECNMVQEAISTYVRVIEIRKHQVQVDSSFLCCLYADVMRRICKIHQHLGDQSMATKALEIALNLLLKRAKTIKPIAIARMLHNIGLCEKEIGNVDIAMNAFCAAYRLRKLFCGDCHWTVAETLFEIGSIHQVYGNYSKALDAYNETVRLEKIALGENHPMIAIHLASVGEVLDLSGDNASALEVYLEVLSRSRVSLGEQDPHVGQTLHAIGMIYLRQGNDERAEAAFAEARRLLNLFHGKTEFCSDELLNGGGIGASAA